MDTVGDGTQAARRPAGHDEATRPPRSGVGAGSAMEQLIRQEKQREAQRLRERDAGSEAAPPRP